MGRHPCRLLIASQPLGEGVPRHVFDLVSGLDPGRFEIRVACPRTSTLWAALEKSSHVQLHEITAARGPSLSDVSSLLRLLKLVRKADLIHAHSAKAGFLVRLAAVLTRRTDRVIFTPHAWSFWATKGIGARASRLLERIAASWCRKIMVVSREERRAGLAAGIGTAAQYSVIPNGVQVQRFTRPRKTVDTRLVAVGRLAQQKRPDLLVEAAALLRERVPDFELQLIGDGPKRTAVETLVRDLGLDHEVRLLGNREDVPELLSEAACFVLASDWEGCPISVLEAMAAGVAVVATRVGGVPEIVCDERTGRLVGPGDAEALATTLADLLERPALLQRFGEEGRRLVRERFTSERMAAQIQSMYDEVLGS
jgi:glycosyltransferase involved in cell wall biosynthesis